MKYPNFKITNEIVLNLLSVVDQGLCCGIGKPTPGHMCVEAAACFALGEPHGDEPTCVADEVRSSKITLNDKFWVSNESRAQGLRRVAVAQLGSKDVVNGMKFYRAMRWHALCLLLPVIFTVLRRNHIYRRDKKLQKISNFFQFAFTYRQLVSVVRNLEKWVCSLPCYQHENFESVMDLISTLDKLCLDRLNWQFAGDLDEVCEKLDHMRDLPKQKRTDRFLKLWAKVIENALVECKSPGAEYLHLVK